MINNRRIDSLESEDNFCATRRLNEDRHFLTNSDVAKITLQSFIYPISLPQKDSGGQDYQNVDEDRYETKSYDVRGNPHQIQRYRIKAARRWRAPLLLIAVIAYVGAKYKRNVRQSGGKENPSIPPTVLFFPCFSPFSTLAMAKKLSGVANETTPEFLVNLHLTPFDFLPAAPVHFFTFSQIFPRQCFSRGKEDSLVEEDISVSFIKYVKLFELFIQNNRSNVFSLCLFEYFTGSFEQRCK